MSPRRSPPLRRVVIVIALAALNLALGAFLAAGGAAAQMEPLRGCCKTSVEGQKFCCDTCCWFVKECTWNSTCRPAEGGTEQS
jgi:hypothetical protein